MSVDPPEINFPVHCYLSNNGETKPKGETKLSETYKQKPHTMGTDNDEHIWTKASYARGCPFETQSDWGPRCTRCRTSRLGLDNVHAK